MDTIVVLAPGLGHTKAGHPENHRRMTAVMDALEKSGVMESVTAVSPRPATMQQLRRVHSASLIEQIRFVSSMGAGC